MRPIEQYVQKKLQERQLAGNFRQLPVPGKGGSVDFYSNDYLGLVKTGKLAAAIKKKYPQGSKPGATGSRLLSGNHQDYAALETKIASFHQAEASLIFNSGYDANIGLLSTIIPREGIVVYDELCHSSIKDGIRLSTCKLKYKFRHNEVIDLERILQIQPAGSSIVIVVESVYSMDGDLAPLVDMARIAAKYNAALVVDEAHATGVFGQHGEGLVVLLGLEDLVFARVHTFGKALGAHGAAVAGSQSLREMLVNYARTFIYTTALPQHSLQAIDCAYDHLQSNSFNNTTLYTLIKYFREKIQAAGMQDQWIPSISTIQAMIAGSNEKARHIANAIIDTGLEVRPILSPTVPLGSERIRICLHSFNTTSEIDRLFRALAI